MKMSKKILVGGAAALTIAIAIGIAVMPTKEERQLKALEQYTEQAIKQEQERQRKPLAAPLAGERLGSKSRNR